jgi:hypothetical protein
MPDGKGGLGRPRRRCDDNIDEIGLDVLDWIHLAQDSDQWLALVNTVMNILVP